MVHRKRETEAREIKQVFFALGARLEHGILAEFEHDVMREIAVVMHIFEELRKEFRIRQRIAGNVAEHADFAALLHETPHDLHAAEQQQIVDHRHQAHGRSHFHILRRHDEGAVFGAQARQRLVEAQLALRQAHDRLEIEVDAVFLERGADGFEQAGFAQRVEIGACGIGCTAFEKNVLGRRNFFRLGRDLGREFAHQPFEQLQLGHDLAALGGGVRLHRGLHRVNLGVGIFKRQRETLADPLEAGDLALHLALLAPADETGMELAR